MARDITAGMVTELTAVSSRPIKLVKFGFDGGDVMFWNGVGDLVFDGDTYLGAGQLLDISEITESEDIKADSVTFTLSGIPSTIIEVALDEDYQGRPVTLWRGAFDANKAIVADPFVIFAGEMDVMTILESGGAATVSVVAESQMRSLRRPSTRKWTSADQKAIVPTDKGFDEVPQIQDEPLEWG